MMESIPYARVAKRLRIFIPVLLLALLVACGQPPPIDNQPDPDPDPDDAPTITSFEADPAALQIGDETVLSWSVENATTVTLAMDGDVVVADAGAQGTYRFSSEEEGEFTFVLTAANESAQVTAEATVTVWDGAGVGSLTAQVIEGSQLSLSWLGFGETFDIHSVDEDGGLELIEAGLTATQAEIPIPASDRQNIRVTARVLDDEVFAEMPLSNLPIVTSDEDYDPFDSLGFEPDDAIEGTLRYWLDHAPEGSVIGFASDINYIVVQGVEVVENPLWSEGGPPGIPSGFDTHLAIKHDLTISGPSTGITIEAMSISDSPDPDIAFKFRSRALLVNHGVVATIENLTITGGNYISNGAGVRNNGTLTIRNSEIVGNRAWDKGGGVFNDEGAELTIIDSLIADNSAVTFADEALTQSEIRDVDPEEYPEGVFQLPDGGYGGGLFNDNGGTVTIIDTTFRNNFARISGGGVFNEPDGHISMEGGSLEGNEADYSDHVPATPPDPLWYFSYGGAILNSGTFELDNSQISGNEAYEQGGGVYQGPIGEAHFTSVNITNNSADWGGGVRNVFCVENFFQTSVTIQGNTGRSGGPETNNLYATEETDPDTCSEAVVGAESALQLLGAPQDVPAIPARER